jgi:hypothetical protein
MNGAGDFLLLCTGCRARGQPICSGRCGALIGRSGGAAPRRLKWMDAMPAGLVTRWFLQTETINRYFILILRTFIDIIKSELKTHNAHFRLSIFNTFSLTMNLTSWRSLLPVRKIMQLLFNYISKYDFVFSKTEKNVVVVWQMLLGLMPFSAEIS